MLPTLPGISRGHAIVIGPISPADDEAWVLTTDEGRGLLAEIGRVTVPGPADLTRWRREATASQVAAALRMAEARTRGAVKFSRAERMWLDPVGLEQATAEPVARHKARRFPPDAVVGDLCAGIGGDTLALAERGPVLAIDANHDRGRRLRWNAVVYEVADRVLAIRDRAESFARPKDAFVHIDPDRRAGGTARVRDLEEYVPNLDFLRTLVRYAPGGALKLGPASDFAAHFDAPGFEIELISLDGECKEATVWFGALASVTATRRATRLPEGASWTAPHRVPPRPARPPSTWIYDPDPALIRAGLVDAFAAAHDLARCAPGVDFLTGPERIVSPFLSAFTVEQVLPFDLKTLRRLVADRRLGPLEIKPRGLKVLPETLRRQLRPPGPNPATLLLIGGPGSVAILARRG